jgi:cobalt-zinc-cadmium efflux system outer membrane protein
VRRLFFLLLAFAPGCQACGIDVPGAVEADLAFVAPPQACPAVLPCAAAAAFAELAGPLDLPTLWGLALAHNPELREAAADLEAARGRRIQAGKYPNPRLLYEQDTIGASQAPEGNFKIEVNQEVLTAGKLPLERAQAARAVDLAGAALVGRKLDVLARVRRAYYDYVSWLATERASQEVVTALEEGVASIRKLVEEAKIRPRTDLLRSEALLEEARISLARTRAAREGAWRQLAATVGVCELPPPHEVPDPQPVPQLEAQAVQARVLQGNTALRTAALDVERARLVWQRAEAEAVPNISVGAGYVNSRIEQAAGPVFRIETALPLWDRKQGLIYEAKAKWVRAQAALQGVEQRLRRETAAALAAYTAARHQVERLSAAVLPRLEASLDLLRKGYEAGAKDISFLDVLQAAQALVTARLTLAEARRSLWLAVADLEGLMQLDLGEHVP